MWLRTVLIGGLMVAAFGPMSRADGIPQFEVKVAVPDGWRSADDQSSYPTRIAADGGDAELLIFRTDLEPGQTISTPDELKVSVQKVIDSVILSLPNSKLISNTGYSEPERTGFALEFIAVDSDDGTVLRHRLFGWLYKHPDGHQMLFTLWGKGALQGYPKYESDIRQMQATFEYTGPHEEIVLSSNARRWALPVIVMLLTLAGLLYYRSARGARTRMRSIGESGWRCSCGAYNAPALHQCRQCGQSRVVARVR